MSSSGKFIVIEGLEGAGKSTAVNTVVNCLQQANINVCLTREPGGTEIGEKLRSILKDMKYKETLDARTELLLLYAARVQLIKEVILPALERGSWVVADRFEYSSFAYQGGGRGLDWQFIKKLSAFCLDGFSADLTIFLDITPEEGMKRANGRGISDRIEQESMDFFHRTDEAYKNLIPTISQVKIIDASAPLAEVRKALINIVDNFVKTEAHV